MSDVIDCDCQKNTFEVAYTECAELINECMDRDTFIDISHCVWSNFGGFSYIDDVTTMSLFNSKHVEVNQS